jgi:hypothetical protein
MFGHLRRLAREQDASFRRLGEGGTVGSRLSGYTRTQRVEAKFFLLALAPFLPLVLSDELGWHRGASWEAWMWLSIAWAVFVLAYMFSKLGKTIKALARRNDERYDREGKLLLPPEYRTSKSGSETRSRRKRP